MSIKNGDLPAMPVFVGGGEFEPITYAGLTKREQFAMTAMQGLLVNMGRNGLNDVNQVSSAAVLAADALLTELERTK